MPPSLSHLLNPGNVSSGVANYFLFAPVSWFANIQCPDDDSIIISEEHDFLPGKDWIKVITSPNTGEVNASPIGEIGSKNSLKNTKVLYQVLKKFCMLPLLDLSMNLYSY
ncbi:MAG: hypothetical protein IPG85_11935 [Bacteroidetes bacterium]|nr:hypothetical protein [Bacteroidota bacterium]